MSKNSAVAMSEICVSKIWEIQSIAKNAPRTRKIIEIEI